MGFVIPQVALQRVIQAGLSELKNNRSYLENIFSMYTHDAMVNDYGEEYIDQIWTWFETTRIPVVQAWSFSATRIPSVSIHLSQEMEDETKAAIGDYLGMDNDAEQGIGVFTVNLDIGIHADKAGDEVLWLYYIINYCLFSQKRLAESMGLYLQTFSGSDYNRSMEKLPDNIWSRWIRFRCTVNNIWTDQDPQLPFENIDLDLDVEIHPDYLVDITAPIRDEP